MKPTVISGGSGENHPAPAVGNQPTQQQPNSNQYPPPDPNNSREYPHHVQSGFSGFRPHFDDMFDDDDFGPHLRARMMRNPFAGFGGGRKRCGFMPFDDHYSQFFADDQSDFFPGFHDPEWDTMRTRRRAPQPQSNARGGNIFDHIPAEFRNILPDNFGFHQPTSQEFSQSYPPQQHYETHPPQSQQHPTPNAQQQYQNYPDQQQMQMPQQRPKYCDASIQTENDGDLENPNAPADQSQLPNQQNLRNSMDFGQKSQQEGVNERRSYSSPSVNDPNYVAGPNNCEGGVQFASTGTDPQSPQNFARPQPEFQRPHPNQPPPPPQRSFIPPQYQNAPRYQNAPQYAPQPEQYPQQQSPPRAQSQEDGNFIRHVPIFVEGRSEPVNSPTPQRSRKFQQQQQPPPQPQQRQAPPQPQQQQQPRPTPLNTQQAQANASTEAGQGQVPQTPQTAQSISKIQDIQRDVLNLMVQVEQFTGTKQDKEYIYLDEMLTRNLLKLDTIDTDGKDRIRLARREAIKCIQASINVLEAKAEENAKAAQGATDEQNSKEVPERPAVIPLPNIEQKSNDAGENASKAPVESSPATNASEPSETVPVAEATEEPKPETENPPVVSESGEGSTQSQENATEVKVPTEDTATAADQAGASGEANATLEPPKEQIEKSSSEKENKPPGSPKKKIVRKVKKVADKKSDSPDSGTTTDETATPPSNEPDTTSASAETAQ